MRRGGSISQHSQRKERHALLDVKTADRAEGQRAVPKHVRGQRPNLLATAARSPRRLRRDLRRRGVSSPT